MVKTVGFWFRRKYNLPPNDPRYLELTEQELLAEYWAHFYAEKGIVVEDQDDDFDADEILAQMEAEAEAEAESEPIDDDPANWEDVNLDE